MIRANTCAKLGVGMPDVEQQNVLVGHGLGRRLHLVQRQIEHEDGMAVGSDVPIASEASSSSLSSTLSELEIKTESAAEHAALSQTNLHAAQRSVVLAQGEAGIGAARFVALIAVAHEIGESEGLTVFTLLFLRSGRR